jgi:hypothetical protein
MQTGKERLEICDIVQHFKRETVKDPNSMDYLYLITDIATHTETKEKLVVYRALYRNDEMGVNYGTYARPYDMFMSEVDHEKYPEIKQKYRFEKFVCPQTGRANCDECEHRSEDCLCDISSNDEDCPL